jgi:MFS family permease
LISEESRKWWTLAAVAFGLFMIMLDNTVVNVALPSIARDLQVDLSELVILPGDGRKPLDVTERTSRSTVATSKRP